MWGERMESVGGDSRLKPNVRSEGNYGRNESIFCDGNYSRNESIFF